MMYKYQFTHSNNWCHLAQIELKNNVKESSFEKHRNKSPDFFDGTSSTNTALYKEVYLDVELM